MSTLKVNTLTDTAATKSVPIEDVVNGTARAWVNFDGTAATSPFTIANGGIRATYNVSSVTDNGTGDYTINFTNAFANANYTVTGSAQQTGLNASARGIIFPWTTAPSTTSARVATVNTSSGTLFDALYATFVIHR